MKKWIIIIIIIILVLVTPIKKTYKDGGTKEYTSLTYKIIDWHRLNTDGSYYTDRDVYYIPKNFYPFEYFTNVNPYSLSVKVNDGDFIKTESGSYTWSEKVGKYTKNGEGISVSPTNMKYEDVISVKKGDVLSFDRTDVNIIRVTIYDFVTKKKKDTKIEVKDGKITIPKLKGKYIVNLDTSYKEGNINYSFLIYVK